MKKLLFASLFFLIASAASAQYSLTFAYSVDSDGNTSSDAAKFSMRDGDEIRMLVRNSKGLSTTQLQFKIYKMDSYGEKTYSTTFYYDMKSTSSVWAYKGIICHSSGYYFIEILNYSGTHLCEGVFYVSIY
jgi:hypothetical protein